MEKTDKSKKKMKPTEEPHEKVQISGTPVFSFGSLVT